MFRIFIGLSVPSNVQDHLRSYCFNLNTNWVKPENFHVTMCFLGEIDKVSYRALINELNTIKFKKFKLRVKGIGYFKSKKGPRVIWSGIDKSKELEQLKEKIDTVLEELGINFDNRNFHPHITIARPQDVLYEDFNKYLTEIDTNKECVFEVEQFSVFSSKHHDEEGVNYTIEGHYPLV